MIMISVPTYTPLNTYLDQPHARNNTGKRNVCDLTSDEIKTLDRADLVVVAWALHGVLSMREVELAQTRRDYYLAKRNEYSALHHESERDVKIAQIRSQGVPSDAEP